jgi:hypothetical protein
VHLLDDALVVAAGSVVVSWLRVFECDRLDAEALAEVESGRME